MKETFGTGTGPASSSAAEKLKETTDLVSLWPQLNQEMNQWNILHASVG